MEIYSLEAEKSCRWEGISTRGFRLGDPGGGVNEKLWHVNAAGCHGIQESDS